MLQIDWWNSCRKNCRNYAAFSRRKQGRNSKSDGAVGKDLQGTFDLIQAKEDIMNEYKKANNIQIKV